MVDVWAKPEDGGTINIVAKIPSELRRVILLDFCIIWIILIEAGQFKFVGTDDTFIVATWAQICGREA
jgi:hypothetical protein